MAEKAIVQRLLRRGLRRMVAYANRTSEHFITFQERPKRAGLIGVDPIAGPRHGPAAIVMQGPVMAENDFTLETLRLYARRMPDCRLILSTWAGTDPGQLAAVEAEGAEIVLSERPAVPGLFNVNMQIKSAAAGVRRAVDGGAEWILKTRTDQRVFAPEAIAFLIALAESFPPAEGARQRHRIVGVGQGSLLFVPYHPTDQTVFGHAEDMALYWTPPLREDPPPAHWPTALADIFSKVPVRESCSAAGAAESYIASSYLERIGRTLDWTLEDGWAAYRDHFCFADHAATDFFWIKGQSGTLRESMARYDRTTNRREIGFSEWLMLHRGIVPVEAARPYEEMLDQPFTPFAPPW